MRPSIADLACPEEGVARACGAGEGSGRGRLGSEAAVPGSGVQLGSMAGRGAAIGGNEGVGDENGDGSAPIAEAAARVAMTAAAAAARTKLSIILKMTFRL